MHHQAQFKELIFIVTFFYIVAAAVHSIVFEEEVSLVANVERDIISDAHASVCCGSLLSFQRVCVYFILEFPQHSLLAMAHQRWEGRGDCPE